MHKTNPLITRITAIIALFAFCLTQTAPACALRQTQEGRATGEVKAALTGNARANTAAGGRHSGAGMWGDTDMQAQAQTTAAYEVSPEELEKMVSEDDIVYYLGSRQNPVVYYRWRGIPAEAAVWHEKAEVWYLRHKKGIERPLYDEVSPTDRLEAHAFALRWEFNWIRRQARKEGYRIPVEAFMLASVHNFLIHPASLAVVQKNNIKDFLIAMAYGYIKDIPSRYQIARAVKFYWHNAERYILINNRVSERELINAFTEAAEKLAGFKTDIEALKSFRETAVSVQSFEPLAEAVVSAAGADAAAGGTVAPAVSNKLDFHEKSRLMYLMLRLSEGELSHRDYYFRLQDALDPNKKVILDLGRQFGEKAIKTMEGLGPEFIPLLVEPGISTRADEFVAFAKGIVKEYRTTGKKVDLAVVREIRNQFEEYLGKITVYRSVRLKTEVAEFMSKNGIGTRMIDGWDVNSSEFRAFMNKYFNGASGEDELTAALQQAYQESPQKTARMLRPMAKMDDCGMRSNFLSRTIYAAGRISLLLSVTEIEQFAKDMGMGYDADEADANEGNPVYLFRIEMPKIYLLQYNADFFPAYTDDELRDFKQLMSMRPGAKVILSTGEEFPLYEPKIESFVEIIIEPEWIKGSYAIEETEATFTVSPNKNLDVSNSNSAAGTDARANATAVQPFYGALAQEAFNLEREGRRYNFISLVNEVVAESIEEFYKDSEVKRLLRQKPLWLINMYGSTTYFLDKDRRVEWENLSDVDLDIYLDIGEIMQDDSKKGYKFLEGSKKIMGQKLADRLGYAGFSVSHVPYSGKVGIDLTPKGARETNIVLTIMDFSDLSSGAFIMGGYSPLCSYYGSREALQKMKELLSRMGPAGVAEIILYEYKDIWKDAQNKRENKRPKALQRLTQLAKLQQVVGLDAGVDVEFLFELSKQYRPEGADIAVENADDRQWPAELQHAFNGAAQRLDPSGREDLLKDAFAKFAESLIGSFAETDARANAAASALSFDEALVRIKDAEPGQMFVLEHRPTMQELKKLAGAGFDFEVAIGRTKGRFRRRWVIIKGASTAHIEIPVGIQPYYHLHYLGTAREIEDTPLPTATDIIEQFLSGDNKNPHFVISPQGLTSYRYAPDRKAKWLRWYFRHFSAGPSDKFAAKIDLLQHMIERAGIKNYRVDAMSYSTSGKLTLARSLQPEDWLNAAVEFDFKPWTAANAAAQNVLVITDDIPAAREALGQELADKVSYHLITENSLSEIQKAKAAASGAGTVLIFFKDPDIQQAILANLSDMHIIDVSGQAGKQALAKALGESL